MLENLNNMGDRFSESIRALTGGQCKLCYIHNNTTKISM